jgi:hypothetical protein
MVDDDNNDDANSTALSDIQIKVSIVPRRLRFPESGTSVAWAKAHDCIDSLEDLARKVDRDCLQAEQNEELPAEVIRRRRAAICDNAMLKLTNFDRSRSRRSPSAITSIRWRG